jgi:hypothetical protein
MASGRQVEYSLKLNSNASFVLQQAERDAVRFETSMWQVQKTLASFGLGLGAHFLIDAAKDWTQAAADFESAMLRIKNASDEGFGIKNQLFIKKEVNEFKTDLQETVDAYGSFLFKIKNANISTAQKNNLFEEILGVGKVAGLTEAQMKPVVNNVSTMLAEGVLEARHLRMLSYTHPQVLPYLADILGLDKSKVAGAAKTEDEGKALQIFSQLLSSGKLTKAGVDSKVLLEAFDTYWNDVKTKLPETLTTLQSNINDLSNTWLNFKNSLVLGQKPELVGFFDSLKSDIKWLQDHQDGLVKTVKVIWDLVEGWLVYKGAMLVINLAIGAYNGISSLFISNTVKEEVAVVSLNSQVALLSANMERLVAIQTQFAISSGLLSTEQAAMLTTGVVGGEAGLAAGAAGVGAAKGLGMGGLLASISSVISAGALIVGVAWVSEKVIDDLMPKPKDKYGREVHLFDAPAVWDYIQGLKETKKEKTKQGYEFVSYDENEQPIYMLSSRLKQSEDIFNEVNNSFGRISSKSEIWISHLKKIGLAFDGIENEFLSLDKQFENFYKENNGLRQDSPIYPHANIGLGDVGVNQSLLDKYLKPSTKHDYGLKGKEDVKHLKGNSSNFFTVHIHGDMVGMKNPKFEEVTTGVIADVKQEVGIEMTRILLEVVNDIQVVKNHY